MTTTCYVITRGDSAESWALAVFTTRELAEAELPKYENSDDSREWVEIQELPLNPEIPSPPPGMRGFECGSDDDGSVQAGGVPCDLMPAADQIGVLKSRVIKKPWFRAWYGLHVWARDKDHAIKIAAEKIAHQRAIDAGMAS
jgi:hypothetical protein